MFLSPDLAQRTIIDRTHVVRYGIFGDVYLADRGSAAIARLRAALLTASLPPPSSSNDAGSAPGIEDAIRAVSFAACENDGAAAGERAAHHGDDRWRFHVSGLRAGRGRRHHPLGSADAGSFAGARSAARPSPAAFAEPQLPRFEDGDPTFAELDGERIRVFIDTGAEGLHVSPALAERATALPSAIGAIGTGGEVRQQLVRFATFRQLGVTRRGQIAGVAPIVPDGYDAIEGIAMLPRLALHFERDETVRADHRGCRTGLPFTTWPGVVMAPVYVSGAPLPFYGLAVFDSGLSGPVIQITYPPRLAALMKRERLKDEAYFGVGGTSKAHCTRRPVTFEMFRLGSLPHELCYTDDRFPAAFGGIFHSALIANPVALLGGPVTIDDANKLICRAAPAPSPAAETTPR